MAAVRSTDRPALAGTTRVAKFFRSARGPFFSLMKFSLRAALAGLWALILALCGALAFLMLGIFEQGVGAQLRQGNERLDQAAAETARRFERYRLTFDGRPVLLDDPQVRADLEAMLDVALTPHPGVEGGFWRGANDGSLAYAFPTHEGPRRKRDVPPAELDQIRQTIRASLAERAPVGRRFDGERASLLLHARPLPGPPPDLALWTMTRAPLAVGKSYQRLSSGLGVLLLLALGSGLWLLRLLRRWTRRVGQLEEAIASTPLEELPALAPTGERELDRIVAAFNHLNGRLKVAREDSARLGRDLARADRLAALGRMAAGLAHEIGNPLAAMRLRTENALAAANANAEPERAPAALRAVLGQIGRLEELLGALRLLTRTAEVRPRPVALLPFLQARLEEVGPPAAQAGLSLHLNPVPAADASWSFDQNSVARAVTNLLLNAIQHTPAGGRVSLGAEIHDNRRLHLRVADTGPGVPAADAERIFEPFVTTRAEGVGLGLSLVREIAEAHGGRVRYSDADTDAAGETRGAVFTLEIPADPYRHGAHPGR